MTKTEILRSSIIDELLTISDKDFLTNLYTQIKEAKLSKQKHMLSESQVKMLIMNEEDVKYNRLISQEDLDKNDLEWIKGL